MSEANRRLVRVRLRSELGGENALDGQLRARRLPTRVRVLELRLSRLSPLDRELLLDASLYLTLDGKVMDYIDVTARPESSAEDLLASLVLRPPLRAAAEPERFEVQLDLGGAVRFPPGAVAEVSVLVGE